jgi:hypothetical protein
MKADGKILCIDLDKAKEPGEVDGEQAFSKWLGSDEAYASAIVADTPSGGKHLYFKPHPDLQGRWVKKVLWQNVDILGEGALCCYADNLENLQELPKNLAQQIVHMVNAQAEEEHRVSNRLSSTAPDDEDQLIDQARWCFQNCPNDLPDRNDVVKSILGLKASIGDRAEELRSAYDDWMDKYPAGNSSEQKDNIWNSKPNGRATIGSFLYHLCNQQGVPVPATAKTNDQLKDWWYVATDDAYFNAVTGDSVTHTAIDRLFGGSSAEQVLQCDRKVIRREYRPDLYDPDDPTFVDQSTTILNSYARPHRRYIPGSLQSPLWAKVEELVSLSIPDEQERRTLLQWLCHNIRYPGRKIRWSILYQGPNGSGKDSLGKLLSMGLGEANVKMVSSSEITSGFNSYSGGACVSFLEEIRMQGSHRWKVYNDLKAPITNDHISLHQKGRDGRTIRNVTNYFASTNFEDAVPIDNKGDRRWYVVACQWETREECEANGLNESFYKEIYGLLDGAEDIVWSAAQDYPLEGFSPHQIPADTVAKQKMMFETMSQLSGELDDVLDTLLACGEPDLAGAVPGVRVLS